MPQITLHPNSVGGIDLQVVFSAKRDVHIYTGWPNQSREFWDRLLKSCQDALALLDQWAGKEA